MEQLNQQHSSDLNQSLRFIQDSFDEAFGSTGNKKDALAAIQDKYEDGQLFQSDEITVNIRSFTLDHNGSLYIDLNFNTNFPKKRNLIRWSDFSSKYHNPEFFDFDSEIKIKLNQLELEKIIAERNQIAKDYALFLGNEYDISYHGDQVSKNLLENTLLSKYPAKDIYTHLILDLKEEYTNITEEQYLNMDNKKFVLKEGDEEACFYLSLNRNIGIITITFEGISFEVAKKIGDKIKERTGTLVEIINIRSQLNDISTETKKNLFSLFGSSKQEDKLSYIKKYQKVLQIFQKMKSKGEKLESDFIISFVQDLMEDFKDNIRNNDDSFYLTKIKVKDITSIVAYYNIRLEQALYEYDSSALEEIKRLANIYSKLIANNIEVDQDRITGYILSIVKHYCLRVGSGNINTDYIEALSIVGGKNNFYSNLLSAFIAFDIGLRTNSKTDAIDLSKYELFTIDMWNSTVIQPFLNKVFIPYLSKKIFADLSNWDLEDLKSLNLDDILEKYNIDNKFVDYIKDYILDNGEELNKLYQSLLETIIREDIDNLSKGQFPDLTKYNIEFNVDNDNIGNYAKTMFIDLVKKTIVFLLQSNPSILDGEQYDFVGLLELLGFESNTPFIEYIKYKAKSESKKEFGFILKTLYSNWMREDINNLEEDIYFEKYTYVLDKENKENFVNKLLLPFIKNKVEENSDILTNLENGTLEDIALSCDIKSQKLYDYIKFNLNQEIKLYIIKTLILSISKDLIDKDKSNVKADRPVDFWKYEIFFAIADFADSIQENFINHILIPNLKHDLTENLQVLEGKDSVSFPDLLNGLGYNNFAFVNYIENNISEEKQVEYLNSLGKPIIERIMSNYRQSNITKKIQVIEKYKNLWLILSMDTKERFVSNFLGNTLSSHVDRDINRIKEGKVGNLDYLEENYEVYSYYMKDDYIKNYTNKLRDWFSSTHKNQLESFHKEMLNSIKKGEKIDLEESIRKYRSYKGVNPTELEKKIDELENNYNSVFRKGENKLEVAYKKVFERGQFTEETLTNLIGKYKKYIDKYFVKNDVSSEEKNMLKMMMYTVCIYYFMTDNYDFEDIIKFAKENDNYNGSFKHISSFLEDINNLNTSKMRKDMNYLILMINMYEKTFGKIGVNIFPAIESISVANKKLDIKLDGENAEHQTGSLYGVVEILFLHKLDDIYTDITKKPSVGRMTDKPLTNDSAKRLIETLSHKSISYEEMKLLNNKLANVLKNHSIKHLPANSSLAISCKYAT